MAAGIPMEVLPSVEAVAARAASYIAAEARSAVAARDRFLLATSGGTTPWRMLELLATEDVPWSSLHLFQVDERIAEATSPARNLLRLNSSLLARVNIPGDQVHLMPVEISDRDEASTTYTRTLQKIAGNPPRLDLIHLGLGTDGHTASLLTADAALGSSRQVAVSGIYQGFRRMTLTFSVINQARRILWVVTGADKAAALTKLLQGDQSIPAAHVSTRQALLLIDQDLAQTL